ncbi:TRAP transporter small permease [Rhodophyticola sp. CCM32]|uniref:TRAP transporter small permease n=1 Tax=Rhodophyticola sp. CCM32 TaxID=2916397 RepID=UPI00107F5F7E|nr:TRAP transporter small permease [Rhodophyticola sp. CCM32]QBY00192.1 TRAP transporter small permease [Rhodophyticola sp. CCM32]
MGITDSIEELSKEAEIDPETRLQELKFSKWDIPVLLVFGTLFAVVFLQFFTRYVLNDSLSWTEEAARYLLILLAFVGVVKCQVLDSHIRLEFIDNFAGRYVEGLKTFALLLTTFFFGYLSWALVLLAKQTSFQNMVSLPYPKYYLYILMLFGLAALIYVQVAQLYKRIPGSK